MLLLKARRVPDQLDLLTNPQLMVFRNPLGNCSHVADYLMINTEHLVSSLKCLLLLRWAWELTLPELCESSCCLPWMERAHNTTDTEELWVRFGGKKQKFYALACSQAKDLFHRSTPNSIKHYKKKVKSQLWF